MVPASFVSTAGHVITNYHVVRGCSNVAISGIGTPTYEGRILASDEQNDLALIVTELPATVVPPFRVGVKVGEAVSVYGFPLAGLLATSGNFTIGNVTALAGLGDNTRFLQISAPVQPGNSGGPLFDQYGNVVGVIVSKLNSAIMLRETNQVPENVNIAIKASQVTNFIEANGAPLVTSPTTIRMEVTEIAERAKSFVLRIICRPGDSTPITSRVTTVPITVPAAAPNSPKPPEMVELTRTVAADQKF